MKKVVGVIIITAVILFLLSGCMSLMTKATMAVFYKDYGVFDKSVPADQMCELRIYNVYVKEFNKNSVSWGKIPSWDGKGNVYGTGDAAGSFGFIKIPAGVNSFVFDWVESNREQTGTTTSGSVITTHYAITTTSVRDISFSNVEMLPGHKYFIFGFRDNAGTIKFDIQDITSMPSGGYGDKVPDAPKEKRKESTKFEGTWSNVSGESIKFEGNTWFQIMPPYTGTNTDSNELHVHGTFTFTDEDLTLFWNGIDISAMKSVTDTSPAWAVKMANNMANESVKTMKQVYLYKYSFTDENTMLLELPWMLPETVFVKK